MIKRSGRRVVVVGVEGEGSTTGTDLVVLQLQNAGWTAEVLLVPALRVLRLRRRPVSLVVAVLGGSPAARRVLRQGSLLARWASVPLVVLETTPGALSELTRSTSARRRYDRVVTRCIDRPEALGSELLTGIGLGDRRRDDGVGPITLEDLGDVVRLHRRCFPDSIMTQLGGRVVDRYYRWQFVGAHPFPYAAGRWSKGELVAFVFGGLRHDAVSGFARRFLPTVVAGSLRHPSGGVRLIGPKVVPVVRLMLPNRPRAVQGDIDTLHADARADSTADVPSFGILSIAVLPEAQGSGIADELMGAVEATAVAWGFELMDLSVNVDNGRAVRFYERHGWRRCADGPDWDGRMIKELTSRRVE